MNLRKSDHDYVRELQHRISAELDINISMTDVIRVALRANISQSKLKSLVREVRLEDNRYDR
jgi:hypothetical protein